MVSVRREIDLEDMVGGDALAAELERHPEGLILRRGGLEVATVVPGREIDRRLSEIPVYGTNGDPLPRRPMTPEQVGRILDIVGSMRTIDTDEMHRIVDESRRLSPGEQGKPDQAADTTRT